MIEDILKYRDPYIEKEYIMFLLSTIPADTREAYLNTRPYLKKEWDDTLKKVNDKYFIKNCVNEMCDKFAEIDDSIIYSKCEDCDFACTGYDAPDDGDSFECCMKAPYPKELMTKDDKELWGDLQTYYEIEDIDVCPMGKWSRLVKHVRV